MMLVDSREPTEQQSVDQSVQQRIAECDYSFVFQKVSWSYEDGYLTLDGCVPSFYLKQVLQEILRATPGVDRIVNNVDVVSSTGLSSTRPDC